MVTLEAFVISIRFQMGSTTDLAVDRLPEKITNKKTIMLAIRFEKHFETIPFLIKRAQVWILLFIVFIFKNFLINVEITFIVQGLNLICNA